LIQYVVSQNRATLFSISDGWVAPVDWHIKLPKATHSAASVSVLVADNDDQLHRLGFIVV
jgi:hypothetical protein